MSTDNGTTMPAVSQALQAGIAITTVAISPVNDNFLIVGLRNGRVFATTTGANPLTATDAASGSGRRCRCPSSCRASRSDGPARH